MSLVMNHLWIILLIIVPPFCQASDDLEDLSFDDDELENTSGPGGRPPLPSDDNAKKELLKRVMTAAMKKPGARTRLGQVLPILRQMSAPQRLALASLVMAQVMADPSEPNPPPLPPDTSNATSQLMLPISVDIANMFKGLAREQPTARSAGSYIAAELYQTSRLRPGIIRRPPTVVNGINRRNANVHIDKLPSRPRPGRPLRKPIGGKTQTCSRVTTHFCLETSDYPEDSILKSIRSRESTEPFRALLSEPSPEPATDEPDSMQRRLTESSSGKGHMCGSRVEIARPKKARTISGQWKYIVNTHDYTQTLRMEICTRPQDPCNFLSDEMDSECIQMYNYHRLLTWDQAAGLTLDVFKVPTCCSCRVLGYGGIPLSTRPGAGDHPDTNLVKSGNEEEAPTVRLPSPAPHPTTPTKTIRGSSYMPPKRDVLRRPPQVHHRGPPLPLDGEVPPQDSRYPPFDNSLRRTTTNNTLHRVKLKPNLNTRHPALPADSLQNEPEVSLHIPPPPPPQAGTPVPSRRINYNYHPIIDYFRTEEEPRAESRVGHDWTPITGQLG